MTILKGYIGRSGKRCVDLKLKEDWDLEKWKPLKFALLAKQGWRLIMNPEYLLARVLKGRYHEQTDFIEARASNGISYVWRGILEAKKNFPKRV